MLSHQREIVAHIEREQSTAEGNRELVRIYEEKVKKVKKVIAIVIRVLTENPEARGFQCRKVEI